MAKKLKYAESYYIRILLNKVKLKEIMTTPVLSVDVDSPFHSVAEKIIKNKIRHLPVIDQEGRIVGLMTERDLYKIQSPRQLEDGTWYYDRETLDNFILKNVMIQKPFTMRPENTVAEAILKMAQAKYGCIPIAEQNGKLVGIVTYVDILRIAAQIIQE